MQNAVRRPLRRLALAALGLLAAALVFAACGDDDDGGSDGTGAASPTPASTTGAAGPTQTDAVDNCDPREGPPSEGEGPDDLVGQIVYVRLIFGCSPDIYVMDADGDNARVVYASDYLDDESDLSPDGTKVVFFSTSSGTAQLYTVNVDGTDLQQLTTGGGGETSPRWSPDGSQIAFSRGGSIFVMNADGTDEQTVMQSVGGEEPVACQNGAIIGGWSPDGERIVYYSGLLRSEGNRYWVCAVDVDDGDVEVLVEEPEDGLHAEPHWSPDGTKIAFRDDRESENCGQGGQCNYDVFVLDLETRELTNVTDHPALDIEPVWSPDGEWIVFASNRDDPNFDLYIIRPDGTDVQRLLNDPDSKDSYPSWR